MMIKYSFFILAALFADATATECSNQGLERCQAPSGTSVKIIRCEQRKEIVTECTNGGLCYGNGRSGIICILPSEIKLLAKRADTSTPFGQYSGGISNLLKGMSGDSASLRNFLTQSRTAMLSDKNAVTDFSKAMSSGLSESRSNLASNSKDLSKLLSTTESTTDAIKKARLFTGAITNNLAPFSYAIYDLGTTVSTNEEARLGLSRAMTSAASTVIAANPDEKLSYSQTNSALNNLALSLSVFYPRTLGGVLKGDLSPRNLATYISAASSGNVNGTANLMSSLFNTIAPGHDYMPAFSYASGRLGRSIAITANPTVVNRVTKRYQSKESTNNPYSNFINSAANAVATTRGKYEGDFLAAFNNYNSNVEPDCGCKDTSLYSQLNFYLTMLTLISLAAPSGACCAPSGGAGTSLRF
ncbi:hypothetical protein BB561_005313 [Smittium simulii]|uniref:Uncharacterized protein n=1 Tax=Smittium simulii TaxID=133385 RepID=A0A2T9YAY9_9FUNG|nr:hypothetical protein BB561_005313 [Smittium simulii]